MEEKIEYIIGLSLFPEDDIFSLDGINYEGIWYLAGKISTGEILREICYFAGNEKFNFDDLGRFCFYDSTIRDVRRRDSIEKYEKNHGRDSGRHIENMIGMPWERIWRVVNEDLYRLEKIERLK